MAKGLGKGFTALFPDSAKDETVIEVSLKDIRPNPYQPRKHFNDEALHELALSIKEHGVIQPIILRKSIKGYEIVAGERRFRASKLNGLETIPSVIRELNDEKMMEIALLENLQREDLNPIEEAKAYEMLLERLKVTQEELSKKVGKSRPYITNYLRLLTLPKSIINYVQDTTLTMAHARTLIGLKDKKQLETIAEKVITEQLNVRQLEILVSNINENVSRETLKNEKKKQRRDIFLEEQENQLREFFGTAVSIKKTKRKGKIEIHFTNEDDFERIVSLMRSNDLEAL